LDAAAWADLAAEAALEAEADLAAEAAFEAALEADLAADFATFAAADALRAAAFFIVRFFIMERFAARDLLILREADLLLVAIYIYTLQKNIFFFGKTKNKNN
jgi:hypothetical protein